MEPDRPLRFTTNAFPKEQRHDAWRFALKRFSLVLGAADEGNLYGELIHFRSAAGIDFVRVTATAQSLEVDFRDQPDCFWMAVLLGGSARAEDAGGAQELGDGDAVCARGTKGAAASDGRAPPAADVHARQPAEPAFEDTLPEDLRRISADSGVARVLGGMLRSLADTIGEITQDQARPLELALPEFLLASLLDNAPPKAMGGAAGLRAALLERIFQTIEMRLSDPNLNYQQVASEHGISPRYLQKLFESIDDSFGHYVKVRRLERCRLDLRSPLHVQKSISDILFQWGFNDSASFSRAFREQYGVSPREYRKAPAGEEPARPTLRRGRPAGHEAAPNPPRPPMMARKRKACPPRPTIPCATTICPSARAPSTGAISARPCAPR
jgi:AraC-like DNA-binding protein